MGSLFALSGRAVTSAARPLEYAKYGGRVRAEPGGRVRGFGDLEAVVMDCLWSREGETTVREVFEELRRRREIAYTTVLSTMDNLYRKDWLARKREGKAFLYWPTYTREQYSARLMRNALDTGGQPDVVLTHFLEQMSEEERAALRRLAADEAAG